MSPAIIIAIIVVAGGAIGTVILLALAGRADRINEEAENERT